MVFIVLQIILKEIVSVIKKLEIYWMSFKKYLEVYYIIIEIFF